MTKILLIIAAMASVSALAGNPSYPQPNPKAEADSASLAVSGASSDAHSQSKSSSDSAAIGIATTTTDVTNDNHSDSNSSSGSDNNITIARNESERPVNSAAPLFSVGCQIGASAQGREAGVNMVVDDVACQYLKLADAEYRMYQVSRTPIEAEYHWKKVDTYLVQAQGALARTANTNLYAKNGINVGLGTLGWGVLGYVIKLGVMAF